MTKNPFDQSFYLAAVFDQAKLNQTFRHVKRREKYPVRSGYDFARQLTTIGDQVGNAGAVAVGGESVQEELNRGDRTQVGRVLFLLITPLKHNFGKIFYISLSKFFSSTVMIFFNLIG